MLSSLHLCRLLRIDSCKNENLLFFLHGVWDQYGLYKSKQILSFTNGPWTLLFIFVIWLVLVHNIEHHSPSYVLIPGRIGLIFFIFNLIYFLFNAIGLSLSFFHVSYYTIDLWSCPFRQQTAFEKEITLQLVLLVFMMKLTELTKPFLKIVIGSNGRFDLIHGIGHVASIYINYVFLYFSPYKIYIWINFVELLHQCLSYGYYLLSCLDRRFFPRLKYYKKFILILNLFKYGSMFAHSVIIFSAECDEFYFLKVVECAYGLIGFILSAFYLVKVLDKQDNLDVKDKND